MPFEDKLTKFEHNVYGYKDTPVIHFRLIVKNKMATTGVFPLLSLIFLYRVSFAVLYPQFSPFQAKLTIIPGWLR